jgi:signal transduction histidine kinase
MPVKTFSVEVQDDHLNRISQVRKPVLAVAELIWNAVDADADHVSVFLEDDQLGDGIGAIQVVDDGHGIPHADAEGLFSRLGGSCRIAMTRKIRITAATIGISLAIAIALVERFL